VQAQEVMGGDTAEVGPGVASGCGFICDSVACEFARAQGASL
jgi:hypothetical protein